MRTILLSSPPPAAFSHVAADERSGDATAGRRAPRSSQARVRGTPRAIWKRASPPSADSRWSAGGRESRHPRDDRELGSSPVSGAPLVGGRSPLLRTPPPQF